MITTRTPNRISLLGGSTDYPAWVKKHGGMCLGGAINKYNYLTARYLPPFHGWKTRLSYSKIETVQDNKDIEHRVIKAVIEYLGLQNAGLEISHISDLPGRCGVGSSSSFTVGLLNCLTALKGQRMMADELAYAAIHVEQHILEECVGYQDQMWAAHGGLNLLRFHNTGEMSVFPLSLSPSHVNELTDNLLLLYTGTQRMACEVAKTYAYELGDREKEMWSIIRLTETGLDCIYKKNWEKLGDIVDKYWQIKSKLSSEVTNQTISKLYCTARICGAFGGKLIGAGAAGCLLLVAPPEKHSEILTALPECQRIPMRFDFDGSQVVLSNHN